jgi:hypothetical protein
MRKFFSARRCQLVSLPAGSSATTPTATLMTELVAAMDINVAVLTDNKAPRRASKRMWRCFGSETSNPTRLVEHKRAEVRMRS